MQEGKHWGRGVCEVHHALTFLVSHDGVKHENVAFQRLLDRFVPTAKDADDILSRVITMKYSQHRFQTADQNGMPHFNYFEGYACYAISNRPLEL